MTALLDACAVIALFRKEPAFREVRALIDEDGAWTTTVNAAEIVDKMVRVHEASSDDIEAELAMLGIEIEPVDVDLALAAGRIRSWYYHPRDCPVSLADCVAAAAALGTGSRLATSDVSLAAVGDDLGATVTPLLNSEGVRPVLPAVPAT